MIAVCPKCSARYRVEIARIGPEGAKLRCTKCSALFLVRVPAAGAAATASAPPQAPVRRADARLVLVADSNEARGKGSIDAIRGWGLGAELVHDGVEAMLAIQRMLPHAIVLDVGMPRMDGFQICEIVKRNESLKAMTVVLVGSVQDPGRDRREPAGLYGADVYLEPPDLPDGLHAIFRQRGLLGVGESAPPAPVRSAPVAPPAPPIAQSPTRRVVAAPVVAEDPARIEERERARRLARIAVSEMLLYQPEKFARAASEGTLERVLEMEIQEARALIRQRIGPEVRAEADFVLEELQRVARERGAKS